MVSAFTAGVLLEMCTDQASATTGVGPCVALYGKGEGCVGSRTSLLKVRHASHGPELAMWLCCGITEVVRFLIC